MQSKHPGIRIKKPNPARRIPNYRAVWNDPDRNGKESSFTFDPDVYPTAEARTQWAIRKSLAVRQRRDDLSNGALNTSTAFQELIDAFLEANAIECRSRTIEEYRRSLSVFSKWVEQTGVKPATITLVDLDNFRTWASKLPKKRAKRGSQRGAMKVLDKPRRLVTVNADLRVTAAFFAWLNRRGQLSHFRIEQATAALQKHKVTFEPPEFLDRHDIKESLCAAMRHDAAVFRMTREEKNEGDALGTSRYAPIAPFLAAAFLTGMRLDELCLITWETHVDFRSRDVDGNKIGHIALRKEDTKTGKARDVSFEVSPLLRKLLLALRAKNGPTGSVFGATYDEAQAANRRIRTHFNAPPKVTFQIARSTCSTWLTNAPGIYGAAAPFRAAKQLGHSTDVQEKHYAGRLLGRIKPSVKTLERAMRIEKEVQMIIDMTKGLPVTVPVYRDDEDES